MVAVVSPGRKRALPKSVYLSPDHRTHKKKHPHRWSHHRSSLLPFICQTSWAIWTWYSRHVQHATASIWIPGIFYWKRSVWFKDLIEGLISDWRLPKDSSRWVKANGGDLLKSQRWGYCCAAPDESALSLGLELGSPGQTIILSLLVGGELHTRCVVTEWHWWQIPAALSGWEKEVS